MKTTAVALADDHTLLRNGLANLINTFDGFKVLFQAANGQELVDAINPKQMPDIVLMDINMPKMDGYETTLWLKQNYPSVKVLALSMYDNETAIIRMMKNGARGYILKDTEPAELKTALNALITKGFHYSDLITGHLINSLNKMDEDTEAKTAINLSEREIDFLKHCCSDLSYKEIADVMGVSPRTVDNYRDALFQQLDVKSRVGLVLFAIKHGIVNIDFRG
jgi:two-component system, NarL family, invasion response regulator UvrY